MDMETKAILKIACFLLFIWLLVNLFVRPSCADEEISFEWNAPREVYAAKLDRFLASYFANCNPRKLADARKLAPVVLDAAERANVNPSIIAAIVSHESTWKASAIGKLGEVGLMQVNNREIGADPVAQLDAGIDMLKRSYDRCGSVIGAISYYATGHTCKPYRGAELRVAMARRIEAL
jgi:soluble lytic murein transglycosylase-like protein